MPQYRLSRAAVADVADLLDWSEEQFGVAAQERYEALIHHAIGDIAAEPLRRGSTERPELGPGVRSWHIRSSRYGSRRGLVRNPRHLLIYRVERDEVAIGRVLHDAMDIQQHVDVDQVWE